MNNCTTNNTIQFSSDLSLSLALKKTLCEDHLKDQEKNHLYLHCIGLLKELYDDFLESLNYFLHHYGYDEVSSCQALMVYSIGGRFLSLQDLSSLTSKTNASYHGRKLFLQGYIHYNTNSRDKRMLSISLTPQGQGLCQCLDIFFQHHLEKFQHLFQLNQDHWNFCINEGKKIKSFYKAPMAWQLSKEQEDALRGLNIQKPLCKNNTQHFKISPKTRYAPKHEVLGLWMKEYRKKEEDKTK